MIRVLGVMTASELASRCNDLVVSAEELKEMARKERLEAILKCQLLVLNRSMEVGADATLLEKIEELKESYELGEKE